VIYFFGGQRVYLSHAILWLTNVTKTLQTATQCKLAEDWSHRRWISLYRRFDWQCASRRPGRQEKRRRVEWRTFRTTATERAERIQTRVTIIIINDAQIIVTLSWIALQGHFTELMLKTLKRSAAG